MTFLTIVAVSVCLFAGVYGDWFVQGGHQYPINPDHLPYGYGYGRSGGGAGRPAVPNDDRRVGRDPATRGSGGSPGPDIPYGDRSGPGNRGAQGQAFGGPGSAATGGDRRSTPGGRGLMLGSSRGDESMGLRGRGRGGLVGGPGRPRADRLRRPGKLPAPEPYVNPQSAVAFSARETNDQHFYKGGPLVFDDVITNIGGGYNPEYGVFTAPVPGIYSITYHASSKPGSPKPVHVDLLRNDEVINSAKGSGTSGTPSNSAVLYLEQFDRVSVNGRAGTAIGCEGNGFCTFNVVLVKQGRFRDQRVPRVFPMDDW